MIRLLDKFTDKLIGQGPASEGGVTFLALDDEIYLNSGAGSGVQRGHELISVFDLMNINSFLFAVPSEPYRAILREILRIEHAGGAEGKRLVPEDCETRTFFHDIPVIRNLNVAEIAIALSKRKAVIIDYSTQEGPAVATYGTVSPEQAFVSFSSTCFSTFVKYFYDHLMLLSKSSLSGGDIRRDRIDAFDRISSVLATSATELAAPARELIRGPVEDRTQALFALQEAGRTMVAERLVDSFFGNISCRIANRIYISETASSLDELVDAVDEVPLDGSSSVGITSSSELATHREIYGDSRTRFILHGHPKFSVVMSMVCLRECTLRGECHLKCKEDRSLFGVPIVPGEIGTGPRGIARTVPRAIRARGAAIVHGHGVFTTGQEDFNVPFRRIREIERDCMLDYLSRVRRYTP
ncbi:MAG: class II aldolase/adducin family protein [Thermodesulfovibrionales bacterium]